MICGSTAFPSIKNTFYLINDNNLNLAKNFGFLQAFFAGTQWLSLYAGTVQSSNVYNVICPGRFQLMWCSIETTITYEGKLRKNNKMFEDFGNKIKSIDIDTLWPDAWKIEISIKSLVPNNYNTHIDYYVHGINSTAMIQTDAAINGDDSKFTTAFVESALKLGSKFGMDFTDIVKEHNNTNIDDDLAALITRQKEAEKKQQTAREEREQAEKRVADLEAKQTTVQTRKQMLDNNRQTYLAELSKAKTPEEKNAAKRKYIENARKTIQSIIDSGGLAEEDKPKYQKMLKELDKTARDNEIPTTSNTGFNGFGTNSELNMANNMLAKVNLDDDIQVIHKITGEIYMDVGAAGGVNNLQAEIDAAKATLEKARTAESAAQANLASVVSNNATTRAALFEKAHENQGTVSIEIPDTK